MKLLWINTSLLHPLDRGGTIRSYNMLRCLKADHDVTYVALSEQPGGPRSERATEYCHRLIEVPWRGAPARASWAFRRRAAANLFSSLPLKLALYDAAPLRRTLRDLTRREHFDVAVADFLFSALPAQAVQGVPRVLFQHNVETLIMQRMAEHARGPARWYFSSQTRRMQRWERRLSHRFRHVVTVSEEDARLTREWYGVEHVSAVATGVDVDFFSPRAEPDGLDVIFVGSLDWLPNLDGIDWLLTEVWPRVLAAEPRACLHLVGRRPTAALKSRCAQRADVRVWGDVPDVREHLERSAVSVVPLRIGGGTRLKVFEALAAAKAVVSTTVGAEGLPVTDGTHLLLADSPQAFAESVVALLHDPERRKRLGQAGRRLVVANHSWSTVTRDFADICGSLARGARHAGSASMQVQLQPSTGSRMPSHP